MDELLQGYCCSLSNFVVEVVHQNFEALQRVFEMRREEPFRVLGEVTQRDNRRPFHVHHRGSNSNDGLAGERIIIRFLALVVLPAGRGRVDGVASSQV